MRQYTACMTEQLTLVFGVRKVWNAVHTGQILHIHSVANGSPPLQHPRK